MLADHVALYLGDSLVVEATPPVVITRSLDSFLFNHSINGTSSIPATQCMFWIKRLSLKYEATFINKVLDFAKNQVGAPYNNYYLSNNNTAFYCSELLVKSFKFANLNNDFFKQHIMKFGSLNNSWWSSLYGGHSYVPKNGIGSHPASLFLSPWLKTVLAFNSYNISLE